MSVPSRSVRVGTLRRGASRAHADGPRSRPRLRTGVVGLTLGALGVVFGDLGTSPLYSLQTVFTADHRAVPTSPAAVYGVISLVFWAITIVVSIKYVSFIMRADNEGEGGIMALTALVQRIARRTGVKVGALVILGIFGACLFYGDGMITPAISVLSAVEGLKVAAPGLGSYVPAIAVGILTVLFVIQRYGTSTVGRLFGPVMLLWFAVIAVIGGREVLAHPDVIRALSPTYAIAFMVDHGLIGFIALASVVLAVTGAEALYADMGHFGRPPIRRAWFAIVFPALTLNYLGQGSLIVHHPGAITNPFFLLVPGSAQFPMVVLATIATVIASQSVISGAFSVTRQAVQLGFLPRVQVRHTSEHEIGQVYVPAVNWMLYAAIIALIVGFGSSARLAAAYGLAVTGTLALNTILFLAVARFEWRRPRWLIALLAVGFLSVELSFLAANLTKVPHGGWLPLVIGAGVFVMFVTWRRGRETVTANRTREEGPLSEFIARVHDLEPPVHRVDGTAVFLNPGKDTTPLALRENVEHNHTLHRSVVIVTVQTLRVPHVPETERLEVDTLGYSDDGIVHVTARFGFQDEPDVPAALAMASALFPEGDIDVENASYFLSRITIKPTAAPGMARWRKRLFVAISRHAADPVDYFCLPRDRTVTMGAHISL